MNVQDKISAARQRLENALSLLEATLERRLELDANRANIDEELALMQDDRSRLAIELDGALARERRQGLLQMEVAQRLEKSRTLIAQALSGNSIQIEEKR